MPIGTALESAVLPGAHMARCGRPTLVSVWAKAKTPARRGANLLPMLSSRLPRKTQVGPPSSSRAVQLVMLYALFCSDLSGMRPARRKQSTPFLTSTQGPAPGEGAAVARKHTKKSTGHNAATENPMSGWHVSRAHYAKKSTQKQVLRMRKTGGQYGAGGVRVAPDGHAALAR